MKKHGLPLQRLGNQKIRFIDEYLVDLNAPLAAERAGFRPEQGVSLLRSQPIQAEIARERARRQARTRIYGDEVVRRYWQLATADARELSHVRYVNCRYCWGLDHRYQYRDHELAQALADHRSIQRNLPAEDRTAFDDLGGGGYQGQRDPCRGPAWAEREIQAGGDPTAVLALVNADHDCPACDGMGQQYLWVADQRVLSPQAAALFDGVEVSKDGRLAIRLRNRDAALKQLGKHFGLFITRQVNFNLDPSQLTDEQLDEVLARFGATNNDTETGAVIEHEEVDEAAEDE